MARGSIRKHERQGRVSYEVVVDLGIDPVSGKRRQRSKSFTAKKEAQTALTAWLKEIDDGTAVDRSKQTVAELLRYWLDTYAKHNVRASTFAGYEMHVRVHLIPALGQIPVQKLTPEQVQQFYSDKLDAGCGPRTVQLCHLHLSQALSQAMRLGLVSRNVTDLVTPPRSQPREMATWDASQQRRFLAAASKSPYGPIWMVALATGMRRGELLGLRWQDVDFERGVLSVRQTVGVLHGTTHITPPKTRSSRRDVAIQPEVVAALIEHKRRQNERRLALGAVWDDHDLLFPAANGKPINPNNLKRDFRRWVAAAGVPAIRIHDVRHSHITLGIKQGGNIKAISQRVGHANISITLGTYAHVLPEQHIEVAEKVGAVLFGREEA